MVNSANVFQAIDDTDDQFVNGLLYAGNKSDLAHDIRYEPPRVRRRLVSLS